jgi:stringent starvation protein B
MNLFQTKAYRDLISEHLRNTITYLFGEDQPFALACETKYITFAPPLPAEIKKTFHETVLFIISGYAYESAQLEGDFFSFEAGFGSENFGSKVHVPLLAVKQVFVGDTPIVINLAEPVTKEEEDPKNTSVGNSMEALLKNPENQKLLKKKR